jgi:hypothetical protein
MWQDEKWTGRLSSIDWLIQWIQKEDRIHMEHKYDFPEISDPESLPGYQAKAGSVDIPEAAAFWKDKGFHFHSLEQGRKHWISMIPQAAYEQKTKKFKVLIVLHQMSFDDPWWAMKTLEDYASYNETFAKSQDTILLYLISEGPDLDRIYGNILQEACVLYPANLDEVYLDISLVLRRKQKLKDIKGCIYLKNGKTPSDPDENTEKIGALGIDVLNISGQWGSRDSLTRCLIMNHKMNEGWFDRNALVHSYAGKEMMEGILLEYQYDDVYHPEFRKYWDDMGLLFEVHDTQGRRWTSMIPKCGAENPQKELPLVLIMQEVYRGNEHLALTAHSYFYRYCEIAAQGECILVFFALEDPDSNDLLTGITKEAFSLYPCDRSRVYITGHSHDSWFARHFAYRHPDMVTALAILGYPYGIQTPEETGNPVGSVSEVQLEDMIKVDMPLVIVNGLNEAASHIPENLGDYERWAKNWQRRLKAARCPIPAIEQIRAARQSTIKAVRMLGLPGDRGETFFSGGFEHHIVDILNNEGKCHLRIAASENMPHTVTPVMIDISYSFLRRFTRNRETGKITELY